MQPSRSDDQSAEDRLDQVIADYLEAQRSGQSPSREELLQRHPELTDELQEFFENHDRMYAVAAPHRPDSPANAVEDDATLRPDDQSRQSPTLSPTEPETNSGGPPAGARIRYFGDYELLQEIARGGMGIVYRARQARLNRVVALKMILAGQFASEADVRRFHSEAEAAAQLDHPGIVPIFEVGEHDGHHFFSMGLVEGESLAHRIVDGPLPPREAAELLRTIAAAVQYAHDKGVIHRDLKPANILMDRDGQPRVTDFGLAKKIAGESDLTATGQVLGTPSYMPPEQAAGRLDQVRETSDVYALGAVLYAALTGRPPFQADNQLDTLMQVLEREPVAPRQLNASVPRDLETICLKCLEKDRRRRYPSAGGLAAELQRFLKGEPIHARPISRPARAWRWCRRQPVVASLLACIAITILVAFTWITQSRNAALEARDMAKRTAIANRELANKERTARERADFERDRADAARDRAEQDRRRSERYLYASRIALAQSEWEHGSLLYARTVLDSCQADLRGWEHDYLYTYFNKNHRTFFGHSSFALCAAYSPDGTLVVSGGGDGYAKPGELKVWDVSTGQVTLTLTGDFLTVNCVAFSPDGSRIVSGGGTDWRESEGTSELFIWDAQTGQKQLTLNGHDGAIVSVAFSPDSERLVSGSGDRTLKVWNARDGRVLRTLKGHSSPVCGAKFTPDGTRIVSGGTGYDHTVRVWDAATGEEILVLRGEHTQIRDLAVSPDGTRIVSANYRTLIHWDAQSGRELRTVDAQHGYVQSVAYSPDGSKIVSGGSDNMIRVWDADTGAHEFTLKGHGSNVNSVMFSPDGARIISASGDKTLKEWDAMVSQDAPKFLGLVDQVHCAKFSPDGGRIVCGTAGGWVKLWDAATGAQTFVPWQHDDDVNSVAFSPDGTWVVSGSSDNTVRLWDATKTTGPAIRTLVGHTYSVRSVAFSHDGGRIVSGSADRTLIIWDAHTGEKLRTLRGHAGFVNDVAFSPDDQRIASASRDHTLKLWNATTGEELLTMAGHNGPVTTAAFSSDGTRIISASHDMTLRAWDAATGQLQLMVTGHSGRVDGAAFSPDGSRIVSVSSAPAEFKVWDAETGQEMITLLRDGGGLSSIAFRRDGKQIVTARFRALTLWDAQRKAPRSQ